MIDLIQDVAHCKLPNHLRTDVISSMPSFCNSEAEGVSSVFDATDAVDHGSHCSRAAAVQDYLVPTFHYRGV